MAEKFSDLQNQVGTHTRVQREKVQAPPPKGSAAQTDVTTGPPGHTDSSTILAVRHVGTSAPLRVKSQTDESTQQVSSSRSFTVTQT